MLDGAHAWLNDVGRWHAHFLQREQVQSVCVSMKQAVGRDAWVRFLRGGEASLPIDHNTFAGSRYVRCRAVTLHSAGVEGFCAATIRVPQKSHYVHSDSANHEVAQEDVPVLRHSRVMPIDAARSSERIGLNALYNCSPLGAWTITVSDTTSAGARRDRLDDLFLEIVVAHQ